MAVHALVYAGRADGVRRLLDVRAGHPGLEWDRYLPLWQEAGGRVEKLHAPLRAFASRVNDRAWQWSQHWRERLSRAAEAIARGRGLAVISWEGKLVWRMTMGLGADHPTENGFFWDHATGAPVIPGRSIKGLCRAAAPLFGWESKTIEQLFGSDPGLETAKGVHSRAVFFDAWPVSWQLEVDVANSHHPKYYTGSDQAFPVEIEDPNPVNFLALAEGARFIFTLLVPRENEARVRELLQSALRDIGIGAKTAVGYGRFVELGREDPLRGQSPEGDRSRRTQRWRTRR